MNVAEEKRIIVSDPQRVLVKYAGGDKEMEFDNEVIEVILSNDW